MSKPEWEDAPEWAEWLAKDVDGTWHWFEVRPEAGGFAWIPMAGRMISVVEGEAETETYHCGWWESLQRRPENTAVRRLQSQEWQREIEHDIIFNGVSLKKLQSDWRRLIEALRPFAESYSKSGTHRAQLIIEAKEARDLLRELGEYPETCKECGQEIRK